MRILSKLGRYFARLGQSDEDQINSLSAGLAAAQQAGLSEVERLGILEATLRDHTITQMMVDQFNDMVRHYARREPTVTDRLANAIVAMANSILNLLGDNPTRVDDRGQLHRGRDDDEQWDPRFDLRQLRVDMAQIHEGHLLEALWQACTVKTTWQEQNDPRWQVCRTTHLERLARDEWLRRRS